MRNAVSALFFLAMVPLGLVAIEARTGGHMTPNVQGTALEEAPHRLLRRGGRGRGRGGRRRDDDNDDFTDAPTPTPEAPSLTRPPVMVVESTSDTTVGPTAGPITEPTTEPTAEPSLVLTADGDMELLLELHNEARCLHNADPLTYSDEVASYAEAHATVLSSDCGSFYHSESEDRNSYGENLYLCLGSTTCYTPGGAMESLYEEEVQFDTVAEYGLHATQILWKSTTELGCAVATCDLDSTPYTYLVCQYNPAGNNLANLEDEVDLLTDNTC